MTDNATGAPGAPGGNAPAAPSNNAAPPQQPATPAQQPAAQPEVNPRSQGFSPARDQRAGNQQQQSDAMVQFSDGSSFKESDLRAALGDRATAASRKATLPAPPAAYEARLPADYVMPEGVGRFEFDQNDPMLQKAREIAHARGIDQVQRRVAQLQQSMNPRNNRGR